MSGDYSRVRFDPSMDIAGVLMQQGRVQIDSDWNTWVAALDRRMRAESVDTFGAHFSQDKSGVAVVSPQTPDAFKLGVAIGPGLYGEYFGDINLSNCMLARTDATVNFDWGNGSPDPLIGADNFSVRWSGSLLAPVTGDYTFHTVSDDGVRLWVNNQKLIENWTDHGATEDSSNTITFTAGQKYDIKLEYYEHLGAATIQLLWTPPGQTKQIVPQSQLSAPNINIGGGRMYVDGLLAENHGGGATEFDSVLAELRGKDPLFYNSQPYLPNPPALPGSGTHLAYLEVWQREVTHHQLPNIIEKAVGVDTTARLQTVWQVRFLVDEARGADCSTPDEKVPGWGKIAQPSGGRMSIQTGTVKTDTDPCELPLGGGYHGLENQLYRIEIHDGGDLNTANFKWSRENASVESNVVEIIANNKLKLASLGRDGVLRFSKDDWVEILDDVRELSGEGGDPAKRRGVMLKITDIDEANLTITLSSDLPPDMLADKDTLALRHTRVRRWDQNGEVRFADNTVYVPDINAYGGLIPVPADGKWVVLEKNILVQFSIDSGVVDGKFRCGDYWLSAARTADASVEEFSQEPPRGIHRHYARLAMVKFAAGTTPAIQSDCRSLWPPECGSGCCTIAVAPGESIQHAINLLDNRGGCVCLKTGTHGSNDNLPIVINSSNITLRGESPGAVVASVDAPTCLQIGTADKLVTDIVVEGIRFEAAFKKPQDGSVVTGLLQLQNCERVRVNYCSVVVTNNSAATLPIGISINSKFLQPCIIENNQIDNFHVGIRVQQSSAGSIISENRISCSSDSGLNAQLDGTSLQLIRTYLGQLSYAIIVEAPRCEVRGNHIQLPSASCGGIRINGDHVLIAQNVLESKAEIASLIPAIYCTVSAGVTDGKLPGADFAVVRDNQLRGLQSGIVVSGLAYPVVSGNNIDAGDSSGTRSWYGVITDDCTDASIENNEIHNVFCAVLLSAGERNCVTNNRIGQYPIMAIGAGVIALQEIDLEVSGNTLQSCATIGMLLIVRGATAVLNNRVLNCGYSTLGAIPSCGIAVIQEEVSDPASGTHLRIEDCEVVDTGISPNATQVTVGNAIGIGVMAASCQITGNRVGYTLLPKVVDIQTLVSREHRSLMLFGPLASMTAPTAVAGSMPQLFGSALVSDNHFRGPGNTALVGIPSDLHSSGFEKVAFSNNICDHLTNAKIKGAVTINLGGADLIAMGNHIKADTKCISIHANGKQFVCVGNITTGPIEPAIQATSGNFNITI